MSQQNRLPDLPPTAVKDWENATQEELIDEVRQLRLWCGQLFMSYKNAEISAAGAETAAIQAERSANRTNENYIDLDKRTKRLDDDLTLIMDFLGMTGEENATK